MISSTIDIASKHGYINDEELQRGCHMGVLQPEGQIMDVNQLEFAVFCIENVAASLGVDAGRVYQAFTDQSDILRTYIVPEYEMLHTQGKEYIVNDIIELMRERGVEI